MSCCGDDDKEDVGEDEPEVGITCLCITLLLWFTGCGVVYLVQRLFYGT